MKSYQAIRWSNNEKVFRKLAVASSVVVSPLDNKLFYAASHHLTATIQKSTPNTQKNRAAIRGTIDDCHYSVRL
jgi:transcriptional regulatory protein LevR